LVKAGLKIFYFSGDNDAIVPIQGTLYWFNKYRSDFKMAIKRSWRPWVSKDQNIAGMLWELDGLTFITVRGAGHMVPSDKPVEA
jgi:serine carboxypeptidase-like clade 2